MRLYWCVYSKELPVQALPKCWLMIYGSSARQCRGKVCDPKCIKGFMCLNPPTIDKIVSNSCCFLKSTLMWAHSNLTLWSGSEVFLHLCFFLLGSLKKTNKKSWQLKLKDATNLIVVFDVLGKYGSQEALLWLCRRLTTPRYIRNCFGNSLQFQKWFDCGTETLRKTNRKVPWVFTTGYRVLGWLMGNCLWPLQPFPGRKGYCFNCCQLQQLQRIIYCFLWQKALWFLWTDGFPIIYPKGQTSHVHKSFSPLNVCLC